MLAEVVFALGAPETWTEAFPSGPRVAARRAELGVSREALCELTDCPLEMVEAFEAGRRDLQARDVQKIVDALEGESRGIGYPPRETLRNAWTNFMIEVSETLGRLPNRDEVNVSEDASGGSRSDHDQGPVVIDGKPMDLESEMPELPYWSVFSGWDDLVSSMESRTEDGARGMSAKMRQEWVDYGTALAEELGRFPMAREMVYEEDVYMDPDLSDHDIGFHSEDLDDFWMEMPKNPHWYFFDSWDDFLAALEVDTEQRTTGGPLRSTLVENLHTVTQELGGRPRTTDLDEMGRYSYHYYQKEFGGISKALAVAGISADYPDRDRGNSGGRQESKKHPSRSELTQAVTALAESLDEVPTTTQMREHGEHPLSAYYREFDGWSDALRAAGLPANRAAQGDKDRREELITELQRLAEELGRAPKTTEMKSRGRFSLGMYYNRYDSWAAALEDAGIR
jgi:transcriptional regulator with XRE-family HTH domain